MSRNHISWLAYRRMWRKKNRKKLNAAERKHYAKNRAAIRARIYYWLHRPEVQEKIKWRRLEKIYGLSKAGYMEIFRKQKGRCAICRKKPSKKVMAGNGMLDVDHNHKTKKIRGLLCRSCNMALGSFRDNLKLFQAAARYLRRTG